MNDYLIAKALDTTITITTDPKAFESVFKIVTRCIVSQVEDIRDLERVLLPDYETSMDVPVTPKGYWLLTVKGGKTVIAAVEWKLGGRYGVTVFKGPNYYGSGPDTEFDTVAETADYIRRNYERRANP